MEDIFLACMCTRDQLLLVCMYEVVCAAKVKNSQVSHAAYNTDDARQRKPGCGLLGSPGS